jgi:hypothetical protein
MAMIDGSNFMLKNLSKLMQKLKVKIILNLLSKLELLLNLKAIGPDLLQNVCAV